MGRILTNYPPKMPPSVKRKWAAIRQREKARYERKKQIEYLLKRATRFIWWYRIKYFIAKKFSK